MHLPNVEVARFRERETEYRVRLEELRQWHAEVLASGDKHLLTLIQEAIAHHRKSRQTLQDRKRGLHEAWSAYNTRLARFDAQHPTDEAQDARFRELDRLMRQRRAVELV